MWLAANSSSVGIDAKAAVYAVAATSCCPATAALLALACSSHARYGTWAATYPSALGPSHAPACTAPKIPLSSAAVEAYWALSEVHAPAAAKSGPGPGPALSNAECTSGGEAIQMGAVMVSGP